MLKKNRENIIIKVKETLENIRPYLLADGGDVVFVELTDGLDVKVRLVGACGHCPFSEHTLKAGVEQALMQEIPIIKSVIPV